MTAPASVAGPLGVAKAHRPARGHEAGQVGPDGTAQFVDLHGEVRLVGLPDHDHKLLGQVPELVNQLGRKPSHDRVTCRPGGGAAHGLNSSGSAAN